MSFAPSTSAAAAVFGLFVVLIWRLREGRRPVTIKTIVIPPVGMATGFSMFFVPAFRVHWTWALAAFLVGSLLLAYPLIRTSRLILEGDTVMVRRSKVFFLVVLVLAAVRYLARDYIGTMISLEQTAGLFFILAFGMIVTWRTSMYFEYKKLFRSHAGLAGAASGSPAISK
ncbi:MAG: cytochrome c biogenesis protein CcdC [Edaphobacter sp.]|uniref:CcdC family protein n=1 Tax=Edaphobacter sp. TaxID=1934404 RepID=UPI0023A38230|nr:cytochrome c biogenesis protein CcdC [Edaphobacter sp.]MDE1178572.1 cytochrome c biogenesis protein CcdC [Edaphobacter sp.]